MRNSYDARFDTSDPRFRRKPKRDKKVKVDKRFKEMFTDSRFSMGYLPGTHMGKLKSMKTKSVKEKYALAEDDEIQETKNICFDFQNTGTCKFGDRCKYSHEIQSTSGVCFDMENTGTCKFGDRCKYYHDISHKLDEDRESESEFFTELSSSSSDSDEDTSEEEHILIKEEDIPTGDTKTNRLAICNLDWRHIGAVDIFVILSSFISSLCIKSVAIYATDFGIKKLEEEKKYGPVSIYASKKRVFEDDDEGTDENADEGDDKIKDDSDHKGEDKSDDGDDDEGDGEGNDEYQSANFDFSDANEEEKGEIQNEKLRQYELDRLKYYVAIVTFINVNSAEKIYEECDGMEFEASSNRMDFRFVPDDLNYERPPTDIACEIPSNYSAPKFFYTTSLQSSKVELTWEKGDPKRVHALKDIFKKAADPKNEEINEEEIAKYMASDCEDAGFATDVPVSADESGDEAVYLKRRARNCFSALLGDLNQEEEEDGNIEIVFEPALQTKTEEIAKNAEKGIFTQEEETPWEAYLRKRKEKKRAKRIAKKNERKRRK